MMRSFCTIAAAIILATVLMQAQPQAINLAPCNLACNECLRITEPILKDPADTWKGMKLLKGAEADTMLNALQLTDSIGAETDLKVSRIRTCALDDARALTTYFVQGAAAGVDHSIYAVVTANGTPISNTCIGILKVDCASTYVRGCMVEADGTLRIAELEHRFDCETDTFQSTEQFDDSMLRLRSDGQFEPVH
ncbi:MAG: hypothetical protein FGM24_02775 [Candidatus Kapabacteria bacterium]|nr:hypothetical protein [Candidatus Kapabacteria bacterium]